MIIWLHIQIGESFHEGMKPLLIGKRTLYIGSASRVRYMKWAWGEYNVAFASFYKGIDFIPEDFDQIIVEGLPINPRRLSQCFYRVVGFLSKCKIPVLFRPLTGQFYAFRTLHKALNKMRPEVGTVVRTKMGTHPIYEGPVTSHDIDPYVFRQRVDKVDGKPKKPGTYQFPVIRCVWEVIDS